MNPFVCLYSVIYMYDDKETEEHGLIYADSFADAAHCLEQDLYGTNLVKITNLELYDTVACFSAETMAMIRKELNQ